jgi:hypothetical protein
MVRGYPKIGTLIFVNIPKVNINIITIKLQHNFAKIKVQHMLYSLNAFATT